MQHRATLLFILFVLFFFSFESIAQENTVSKSKLKLSLGQVWEKAELYNKTLQIQRLKVEGSEQQLKDAKAERLPEISAGTLYSRISNMPIYENGIFNKPISPDIEHNYFKVNGDAYLNLYNGHKVKTKVEEEEIAHQLTLEQKNLTTEDIRLKVSGYYLELKRDMVFKDLVVKNISEQEKRLEEIQQLHTNGVVLRSDLLRAELQLSKQKMNLTEIVNDIALANQKLAIMIGEPEDINIIPEPGILLDTNSKNYDQYLAEAFEHSYGIKISEKQTELSKLQLKEVKSNALPRIGLFAEYSYTYPQILFYPYANALYGLGQAGIKIFFPISSLYHNRHKENAAAIEIKKQELAHEDEKDVLRQQVKEAYVRYKESLTRIAVSEANIKQATENYRIVKNTYFNQLALLTDLMDADTQLLQSRFGFVSAQISAQLHYYQLQKTIGTL